MEIFRKLILLVAISVAGCAPLAQQDQLCSVIANPQNYLGQRLALSGAAQMYQHASTLRSEFCPGQVLFLAIEPYPPSDIPSEKFPKSAGFFTKLAMRPGSPVTVTGRVARTQIEPWPYVFVVESGVYKSPLDG